MKGKAPIDDTIVQMSEEFRSLMREIDDFLKVARNKAENAHLSATDMLMAQTYRDLSSRSLRLMRIVGQLEDDLSDSVTGAPDESSRD